MKRWLSALTLLAAAAATCHGQALGPGAQGAVLKQPWDTAAPPRPATQAPLQGLWTQAAAGQAKNSTGDVLRELEAMPPDINEDIAVTKELGPWMISVIAYLGPNAPMQARKMVGELREKYKLPAYVFNYGAEERRKAYQQVKEQIDKQRELLEKTRQELAKNNLADAALQVRPIPIKRPMHVQENCAVLVGGYKDEASARRVLEQIRKLDPKLLERSLLDMKFYGQDNPKTNKIEKGELVYVDPFPRAFLAPNPAVRRDKRGGFDEQDLASLRRLNQGQPYNLMDLKKRYTLAIKQFSLPSGVQTPGDNKVAPLLDPLKTAKENDDLAAKNAHTLAQVLRQTMKLDAYVLHTRYASIVTVGGFDSLDDPALRSLQNVVVSQLRPKLDARVELFPQPLPMEVPH